MVMFWLVIAVLVGWCALGCTPPTTIPAPESSVKLLPVTVIPDAPRAVPEAVASLSLPMPSATCPRWVKASAVKVMLEAAETCTAAGAWFQVLRVASNCRQPDWQEVRKFEGCWYVWARK